MTALTFQLPSKVPHTLGIRDPIDSLAEMFSLIELCWRVVLGAIGGVIAVMCVKMWQNKEAAILRERGGQKLPQEHDERFG